MITYEIRVHEDPDDDDDWPIVESGLTLRQLRPVLRRLLADGFGEMSIRLRREDGVTSDRHPDNWTDTP